MTTAIVEPVYNVLVAQARNIARINTGTIMEGTTSHGDQVTLWGPAPNLVRLYDDPLRLVQQNQLANWERLVTLMPIASDDLGKIIGRSDRQLDYQVQLYVRLTPAEMTENRLAIVEGGDPFRESNPLLEKVQKLLWDWHHVFHDNLLLTTDDCPRGLVNHASYELIWDDLKYPECLVHAIVTTEVNAWG